MEPQAPLIGVFWVADVNVFGKAVPLSEAASGLPGLLNSQDTHSDLWEHSPSLVPDWLRGKEYFEVPRGRVLYSVKCHRSVVYLDDLLLRDEIKGRISAFFQLCAWTTLWRRDVHYTTADDALSSLFDD